MRKLVHVVFLTILLSHSAIAQDKVWQMKLSFKGQVSLEELGQSVPEFAVDFYEPFSKGTGHSDVQVFTSPSKIKSIDQVGRVLIADRIQKQEYSYTTGDDVLSQEALFQDYPLLKSPTDQSDAYLILEEGPDQEMINGINCVKATLKVVNPDEGEVAMTVWYAPEIPSYYVSSMPFLIHIPGAVLRLNDQVHHSLGFEVSDLTEVNGLKEFDLPQDMKIVKLSANEGSNLDDASIFQDAFELKAPLKWFSQHSTSFGDEHLFGVKKTDGTVVQPANFYSIDVLNKDRAIVSDSSSLFWIIDDEAKKINQVGFEVLYGINEENMVYAIEDHYGIINASGVSIIGGLSNISNFVGSYLLFSENNKQGLMDFDGNIVLKPVLDFIDTDDQGNILVKDLKVSPEIQQYSLADFQEKYLK
ncbi:hypothetical protein KO02_07060 [Sphingobacterium sp. ML3W]|uniref:hypothetical protein n=1 Tax=Sphingobacterium sp. ML3W TaxID=1538644 RepID=UPI0004F59C45|nr:hypothetical protein [Sphingobacterium sp. ML3W]AIM36486.1 hypothetical protein KO02_07060 [Sphingobacterium sp. ML3W]